MPVAEYSYLDIVIDDNGFVLTFGEYGILLSLFLARRYIGHVLTKLQSDSEHSVRSIAWKVVIKQYWRPSQIDLKSVF